MTRLPYATAIPSGVAGIRSVTFFTASAVDKTVVSLSSGTIDPLRSGAIDSFTDDAIFELLASAADHLSADLLYSSKYDDVLGKFQ